MRSDRLIRNIRLLLFTALTVALPGCREPAPPGVDPLELELAGLTMHERAALIVAAALQPDGPGAADPLRSELATGAAGAIVIEQARLQGAAPLLDTLRTQSPLPLLVIVEFDREAGATAAGTSRPDAAAAEAAEMVGMAGEQAGWAVFAAGGDLALVPLPSINRDEPLPLRAGPGTGDAAEVAAYLEGLRRSGLLVAVRTLTSGDSSSAPLRWDRARLEAIELPALGRVVENGVSAVELGGVKLPSLTGDSLPLPLSTSAVHGLVRRDLAFEGVVMADLSTASLPVRERGMPAAAVEALAAGVDLLLGVEAPAAAVDAIAAAVEGGRLAPARLEEAARRVMRLRVMVGVADSARLERRRRARAALWAAAIAGVAQGAPEREASGIGFAGAAPGEGSAAGVGAEVGGAAGDGSAAGGGAGGGASADGERSAAGGSAGVGASAGGADRPGGGGAGSRPMAPPASPMLRVVPPDSAGMAAALGARIDALMREALEDSVFSGAAVAVGRRGRLVLLRGYGRSGRGGEGESVDPGSTIFDIASLTKVVGTTTAAALLVDNGRMELDAPLQRYLPEFEGEGKEDVLIRHLLSHTSGLPSGIWVFGSADSPDEALQQILEQPLVREPGERMEYSDLGMILLATAVERVTEMPIDRLLAGRVFAPLGMQSTMYLPPLVLHGGIVPTAEITEREFPLQGIVHDANSFRLGGVAGHAGLFTTARDLAVFAQMMLNGGGYGPHSILSPATVATFTRRQPRAEQRALGWDTPSRVSSAGAYFSARSFGHTGYTGTSLWIDPRSELFVVLLTNRTYVKASAREILRLRAAVHDVAARAVTDQPVRRR